MTIDKHNQGWAEYMQNLEQQNADLLAALKEIAETDIEFPYDVVKDMQWTAEQAIADAKGG